MKQVIFEANKLCKSFQTAEITQHVLKNLDLEIYESDFTVIMGSSGSGKSTLLYTLSGMDTPTMGSLSLYGTPLNGLNNDELALLRRKYCGFIFQSIHLLDTMNVMDNVLTGALLVNHDKKKAYESAVNLLKQVGLNEVDFQKFPNQLSGGEQQRVAIVRAMINQPKILFADEPTGALNSVASTKVLDEFTKLHQAGQSILMVTHDIKTALRGSRVIYLRDGSIQGDLELGAYTTEDREYRTQKLKQFLSEMGW